MITLKSALRSLLAAFALLVLGGSSAHAATNQTVFFEAPRDLTAVGSQPSTDATRAAAFADFERLGVKALRVNLRWYDVAPDRDLATKPSVDLTQPGSYNWSPYTSVIDTAKAKGWTLLISLSAPVPKWATASKADNYLRPVPAEFKAFATAAARQFGAPNVIWSIWNEPNLETFLKPQLSGGKPVSPAIYRELYVAGRDGIKVDAGLSTTKVLFGETAPVGGAGLRDRIYPLQFLREALCLTTKYKLDSKCGGKLEIDGLAHHPYQFSNGKLNAQDATYRSMSRLVSFLDKAAKDRAIAAGVPIYLTEFGIQSKPDLLWGFNYVAQYEVRARAERAAFYNKRVKGFSQYLLTDDVDTGGFQTGLRLATGKAKPAYNAFRLTLDAKPAGGGKKPNTSLWGLVRTATAATTVTVQVSTGGAFKKLKAVKTNRIGAFTLTDKYRKGARYRYQVATTEGTLTSPYVVPFSGWLPPNPK
ncbi:MAG: cellulase family glycosylhydrolase [Solirubrobacteraceae bacterium]|nr:cellulase family glycosylhydrolase [Solirubrobacteraceae bacterium]